VSFFDSRWIERPEHVDELPGGLPQGFRAGRYHSLIVERASVPDCLEVSATSPDGLVMALRHRTLPVEGVQFHPESILTPEGKKLLANFLNSSQWPVVSSQ
jgi:anthranilate/para-aminobenzoate synthase component II